MFLMDFMILTLEVGPARKRDSNVKINPLVRDKHPLPPDNAVGSRRGFVPGDDIGHQQRIGG